jgi:ABC-type transport system involved in cytochrome c biogenesis permease subunit
MPGVSTATGNTLLVLVSLGTVVALLTPLFGAMKRGDVFSEQNFLYVTLIFFAAATALYLGYAVTGVARYVRFATVAAICGFVGISAAVADRWMASGNPPFSNIYEMLLSFVWTLAVLTLFVEWKYGVRVIGTVTMPLAVISVVLMQLLPSAVRPLVPALQSTWLHIHVTLAMLAYAACAVSFALAMMFLIRDRVRTEDFLAGVSAQLTATYLGIATRFDGAGGLQVIGWDAQAAREIFVSEKERLLVVIPNLGWLFFMVLAFSVVPLALTLWARWNKEEQGYLWANRVFLLSTAFQMFALFAFVARVRIGAYPSPQVDGLFGTHLAASPFILAGVIGGLFASFMYLLLCWRREGLEEMMPSSETLDKLTYKTIGIAFPLLTLMIAAGAYWANRTWGSYWSWDPKETWALITWFIYAGYLHMRITRGWRGRRAAYFAILGFVVVLFTFFGVTYLLPGLHAYS